MTKLLESIARWIDRADAGDIAGVLMTGAMAGSLLLLALSEVFN